MNDTSDSSYTLQEYATNELAVKKLACTKYPFCTWGGKLHMVPNEISLTTGTVCDMFIKWHMGDQDTGNIPLKYLTRNDIASKSLSTFKKAKSLMQKLMNIIVENGCLKRNVPMAVLSYDKIVHLVEDGMKILRLNATSNGIDTSKHRSFLETPFVTFYESLIPKTERKRKLGDDQIDDTV